jgi:hypothetical protein
MRINEITGNKPKTPADLHVDALKKQADQASSNLRAERQRQRIARANKSLARLKASSLGGDNTGLTS